MYEKRVRDIMGFASTIEVSPEVSLKEVVIALAPAFNAGYKPTIIVKDGYRIKGVIYWSDILNIITPAYAKGEIKMELFWNGLFMDQWYFISNYKVKELLRKPVSVGLTDTLARVAYIMVSNNVDAVLVEEKGKLLGMIGASDLFKELYQYSA